MYSSTYTQGSIIFYLNNIVLFRSTLDLMLYANLFNAKFYINEIFSIGHVAPHGVAGSITCASAYAHAQLSAFGRTCTSWLITSIS